MSFIATYRIEGLRLEAGVFKKMHTSNLEKDDSRVVGTEEEKNATKGCSSAKYNGVRICTKSTPDCYMVYNSTLNRVSIAGHEGNNLVLHLDKEGTYFEAKGNVGYLDDNYDNHLTPLLEIIEAFRGTCRIILDSQEGGDTSENGAVYIYKDGQEQA